MHGRVNFEYHVESQSSSNGQGSYVQIPDPDVKHPYRSDEIAREANMSTIILRHLLGLCVLVTGMALAGESPDPGRLTEAKSKDLSIDGDWMAPSPGNEQMTLISKGTRVSGQYRFTSPKAIRFEGSLEAERQGQELSGQWMEHPVDQPAQEQRGRMHLKLSEDGESLKGWYGDETGQHQQEWIMLRKHP